MAIYRSKNTGAATGGNGSDFTTNACGTIAECRVHSRMLRWGVDPEGPLSA